jgi:hypothetical protein
MSALELSPEHVQVLVSAARDLGIPQLVRPNGSIKVLHLDTEPGRASLFELLWREQSFRSTQEVCAPSIPSVSQVRLASSWLTEPSALVQVLQWVRCYKYQCGVSGTWSNSDARILCAQIIEKILDHLAAVYDAGWTI